MIDSALAAEGFDLIHRFDALAAAGEAGLDLLADPLRRRGLLVGNTRALWPKFLAALRADPALAADPHPLERYTERVIDRIASSLTGAQWWFSHRRYAGAFLPLQRLAVATGLGRLAPTHLVIHPTYGPWFALRAIIVCVGPGPTMQRTPPACTCDHACEAAFHSAVAATGPEAWRAWLAVRDACPIGREHRYSDDQIAYHYALDRRALR